MKNKIKYIIILIVIMLISIISFYAGLNFYDRHDVNRDGKVSAVDYVLIKNYIMNEKESDK